MTKHQLQKIVPKLLQAGHLAALPLSLNLKLLLWAKALTWLGLSCLEALQLFFCHFFLLLFSVQLVFSLQLQAWALP